MSNPWFRLYSEAIDDEKLRLVAFEDRWHFVALLCCKNMGILDELSVITRRKIAVKMGLDLRELGEVARRLAEVGLIDQETLQPKKWDERQFISDSSAARTKAYRERMKRHSDVTVTVQEEDTDTDKDKETEKKRPRKKASRIDPEWTPSDSDKEAALRIKQMTPDEMRVVADEFRDYWLSKADGAMVDWSATWRNWIRRRAKWEQERNPASAITVKKNTYFDN